MSFIILLAALAVAQPPATELETKVRALIAPSGAVEYVKGFEAIEISAADGGGMRVGAHWQSPNLAQLGDYRLWVDRAGRLRLKKGTPTSDEDGNTVGT